MQKNRQNIAVMNENGDIIGSTYPKRAKGLIKKRRAEYLTDNTIRLYPYCPTENAEEFTMDALNNTASMPENAQACSETVQYVYLNPKKWSKNPDTEQQTNFDRFFMSTPFGEDLREVLSIGTWGGNWCEITNGVEKLNKNSRYQFVFWLNGGENDRNTEICQLHIIFTDNPVKMPQADWDNKLCFKLNRSYIRPLRKYKGWELYSIPFVTNEKEFVQFRFVAQYAPMTVMRAEAPEFYSDMEDNADPFEGKRPQRHNIVFEDGWPTNTWYSTNRLKDGGTDNSQQNRANTNGSDGDFTALAAMIANFIDTDAIADALADNIDIDAVSDAVINNIDIDEIKEAVIEKLND